MVVSTPLSAPRADQPGIRSPGVGRHRESVRHSVDSLAMSLDHVLESDIPNPRRHSETKA